MEKFQSLADILGVTAADQALPSEPSLQDSAVLAEIPSVPTEALILEQMTGQEFCEAVVNSLEFRRYIVYGLRMLNLPPAVVLRIMNQAWGKVPDRIEHTGKDGAPITAVTEIRHVIVRPRSEHVDEDEEPKALKVLTH